MYIKHASYSQNDKLTFYKLQDDFTVSYQLDNRA